jgi:hypothetical protein
MLMDAMARCARVAENVGGGAIVVDAIEEGVTAFYERVGFTRFEPGSLKMFILMATVRQLLGISKEHQQGRIVRSAARRGTCTALSYEERQRVIRDARAQLASALR